MAELLVELPALEHPELLAPSVFEALQKWTGSVSVSEFVVVEIDPEVADTAACCERYGFTMEKSANCVVIAGKRGDTVRFAACNVLATTRADINGVVRKFLDARKASFAPMGDAVAQSGMEYGGITPIGLPAAWPVLVDSAVIATPRIVLGSGLRKSKLLVPGAAMADVPGVTVLEGLGLA